MQSKPRRGNMSIRSKKNMSKSPRVGDTKLIRMANTYT